MGRIRLRVRDIDYPEPAKVNIGDDNKSQKSHRSGSPRSKGKQTGLSSARRASEPSILDLNDIEISRHFGYEGHIGEDGGIELASPENQMDIHTLKNAKTTPAKKLGPKSEQANYTEKKY